MKKIYIGIAILMACTSTQAQYKKASFLTKSGRTYELGGSTRFMSESGATTPGVYYSFGIDKGSKTFQWLDLELMFPTKFSYTTMDNTTKMPMTVSGKSKLAMAYRYNFGYYLLKPDNTSPIKPFITAGLNLILFGSGTSDYEYSIPYGSPKRFVDYTGFSYGANTGVGGVYNFSEKLGLRIAGGYNWQGLLTPDHSRDNGDVPFKTISNHPYITLGLRLIMVGDNE